MGSTFGGLNTVVRGLYAQQVALDTVGHNISNANTEGYSRQNVNMATTSNQTVYGSRGMMQVGTGVNVESIMRARDTFVDKQMWKETSSLGYGQSMMDTLAKVEGVFQEPTATGFQTVLNKFWTSLQTLAANASDEGARATVRQRGVEVVNALTHASQQLKDMAADMNSVIDIKVSKVNQITSEISTLNRQISNIEVGGVDHANDLRDKRDLLVDQLSTIMNVNVNEDKDGNYSIQSAGITLVNGYGTTKLGTVSAQTMPYNYEIKNVVVENTTGPELVFKSGELKALLDARDSDDTSGKAYKGIKGYLDNLNTISQFLLQDFNEAHKAGYGTDNSTNTNFFGTGEVDYTSNPVSDWIAELKVNSELFDPANGLAKIAAKTLAGNIVVAHSTGNGGTATVNVSGSYTATDPANVMVQITGTAGDKVTGFQYSTDGGSNWTPVVAPAGTGNFTVNGLSIDFTVADSANNKVYTATPLAGDSYTFTVPQGNAAGDNAIVLGNWLKTEKGDPLLGDASLESYYSTVISSLGVQAQDSKRLTENQKTLVGQITNWRESTAGVNMDEEMTNMIRFQKGYNAAARIMTTMDEMLDKLINGTGIVGR
ncbi:Flagellar hook-associated protein 1 [bioreactor metagenome]|uniref:Flagellar hook-associated protein 1 n=1 Tax=bioreactor metagenome TaxID=1076179 RepID=A0A644W2T9_9ZZZZ